MSAPPAPQIQSSPVQSSPIQFSPIQSSLIQSSPIQSIPILPSPTPRLYASSDPLKPRCLGPLRSGCNFLLQNTVKHEQIEIHENKTKS